VGSFVGLGLGIRVELLLGCWVVGSFDGLGVGYVEGI